MKNTHDSVLVIDLDDDYRRIVSQFTSLAIELHIIEHQQLIPCRTQRLIQDLREIISYYIFLRMSLNLVW